MADQRTKTIERIKKLLAMAKDVSSPEEAAIAAIRARKLMDEHQLQESDLITEQSVVVSKPVDKIYSCTPLWKQWVCSWVSKLNDCIGRMKDGRLTIYGLPDDVEAASLMYSFLIETITTMSKTYMVNFKTPATSTNYLAKYGDAFKKGAAMAVSNKIERVIQHREMMTSNGTNLILCKMEKIAEHLNIEIENAYRTSEVKLDQDTLPVFQAGYREGNKIEIDVT